MRLHLCVTTSSYDAAANTVLYISLIAERGGVGTQMCGILSAVGKLNLPSFGDKEYLLFGKRGFEVASVPHNTFWGRLS